MARKTQWWFVTRTEGGLAVKTRHRTRRGVQQKVGWLMGRGVVEIQVRKQTRVRIFARKAS